MDEIAELEAKFDAITKKIDADAEELKKAVTSLVDGTKMVRDLQLKKRKRSSSKSRMSETSTKGPKHQNSSKKLSKPMAASDFEIPVCYGSIELREALNIARKKLKEAIDVGNKAKQQLPTQYVEEVDNVLNNFVVLREAFAKMLERMEMFVSDELSEDTKNG